MSLTVSQMAKASQLHYNVKNKFQKKHKKEYSDAFNGYEIDKTSDNNVMGMYNKDKAHLHINHRGTSKPLDLVSDRLKTLGLEKIDPQYNSRRKHTKQMIKSYPDAQHISASGHSMGGDTLLHAVHQSPSLAKHIDEIKVFNPLSVKKYDRDKDLHKKTQIHRTKDDIVSMIKQPYNTIIHKKNGSENTLEAHGLHNFINEEP